MFRSIRKKLILLMFRNLPDFLNDNNFIKKQDEIIDVEPEIIRAYLSYLYRQKVKKVTVNRKVSSLRAFYKYLLRNGKD